MKMKNRDDSSSFCFSKILVTAAIGAGLAFPGGALADEYGREVEAPTLFTGETTMVSEGFIFHSNRQRFAIVRYLILC